MVGSLRLSSIPRQAAASGDRPSEDVDGSVGQGHDGALGVLALADALLPNHRCHPVIVVDFSISSLTECVG
jgi:hypothetical protein